MIVTIRMINKDTFTVAGKQAETFIEKSNNKNIMWVVITSTEGYKESLNKHNISSFTVQNVGKGE